jgi:nucleoside 2-deoxyribosyltransferase
LAEFKCYVAGRTKDVSAVQRVQAMVRGAGGEITFDWTGPDGEIRGDWSGVPDRARAIAATEREGVREADLLILVWHEHGGLGALLETGMAMAQGKRIIVYGAPRESVFWYLPKVEHAPDALALMRALGVG